MSSFLRRHALWLTLLPVLGLMILIFCFSAQPAAASDRSSGGLVELLLRLLYPDLDACAPAARERIYRDATILVRKSAHFVEYGALGFALLGHLLVCRARRGLRCPRTLAFALGALYAASDELHQLFVPGRSGELGDVLLDSLGVAAGVYVLKWIYKKRRKPAKKQDV
jgi:VanZ family protein